VTRTHAIRMSRVFCLMDGLSIAGRCCFNLRVTFMTQYRQVLYTLKSIPVLCSARNVVRSSSALKGRCSARNARRDRRHLMGINRLPSYQKRKIRVSKSSMERYPHCPQQRQNARNAGTQQHSGGWSRQGLQMNRRHGYSGARNVHIPGGSIRNPVDPQIRLSSTVQSSQGSSLV